MAATEAAVAATAAKYPQFAGKQAVMATPYEGIFVYGPQDPRGRVLAELGLTFPPALADVGKDEFGSSLSVERANLLNIDAVIWLGSKDQVDKAIPTFSSLSKAKSGNSLYIAENEDDPFYMATSFVTVLSLPYMVDTLAPKIATAIDGDPGTETSS